ncbi:20815_t:CDS:2, partial [Dentiscutata erythropus]
EIDDVMDDSLIIDYNIGYNNDFCLYNPEYTENFCNFQNESGFYIQFFQEDMLFQEDTYDIHLCNNNITNLLVSYNEFQHTFSSIKNCKNVSNVEMNL